MGKDSEILPKCRTESYNATKIIKQLKFKSNKNWTQIYKCAQKNKIIIV